MIASSVTRAVVAVAASTLAACTALRAPSPPAPSASPVIDRILQRGVLRVGTSGNQPPLNETTAEGRVIGFDADLASTMAAAMGVELALVTMPFADLIPALQGGEVDLVLSGMTMTPQRNLKVAFVGPYLVSGMSILTKSRTLAALRRVDEINTPEVTLVTLRGSTGQTFVENVLPEVGLVLTSKLDEAVELLRGDKVDALVADHPFCLVTVDRYRDEDLTTLAAPFTSEPLGIALPPGDPLLVNWTENLLADLDDSGALFQLTVEWFESVGWMDEPTQPDSSPRRPADALGL